MSTTLSELVNRTRFRLRDSYKNYTTLASALNATANSAAFAIGEHDKHKAGDLIEIGDEVLKIVSSPSQFAVLNSALNASDSYFQLASVNSSLIAALTHILIDDEMVEVSALSAGTNFVYLSATRGILATEKVAHNAYVPVYNPDVATVVRGFNGSSAYAHTSASTVYIDDTYTDYEIKKSLRDAAHNLKTYTFESYFTDTKWPESYVGGSNTAAQVAGWTATQDATAPILVTSSFQEGNGSIGLGLSVSQSAATYGLYEQITSAIDTTDLEYFNMKLNITALQDSNNINIFSNKFMEIGIGLNSANYYNSVVSLADVAAGVNQISNPFKRGTVVGTESSIAQSAITYFALKINEAPHNPTSVTAGNITIDDIKLSKAPYTNSANRIDLPRDVYQVGQMDVVSNGGATRVPIKNFRVVGNDNKYTLYIDRNVSQGDKVELHGAKMYDFDSTDALNIPESLEEFMSLYATKQLMESRMPLDMRFDKFSARINKENATLLDYVRIKREYEASLAQIKAEQRKPVPALRIDFGQRYGA
jgi:hypothetical protein